MPYTLLYCNQWERAQGEWQPRLQMKKATIPLLSSAETIYIDGKQMVNRRQVFFLRDLQPRMQTMLHEKQKGLESQSLHIPRYLLRHALRQTS